MCGTSGRPARFGRTSAGRLLFVVYEVDDTGGSRVIVPVTAYEPDELP
jgi:hypothetical protein